MDGEIKMGSPKTDWKIFNLLLNQICIDTEERAEKDIHDYAL